VRIRQWMTVGLLALLGGCASTLSPQAERIVEARHSDVRECRELGDVRGNASGFHWSSAAAMNSARDQALEQAADIDATHVVWEHSEEGMTAYVAGTAFRCS